MNASKYNNSIHLTQSGGAERFTMRADNNWHTGYLTVDADEATNFQCFAIPADQGVDLQIEYFDIGFCSGRDPMSELDFE